MAFVCNKGKTGEAVHFDLSNGAVLADSQQVAYSNIYPLFNEVQRRSGFIMFNVKMNIIIIIFINYNWVVTQWKWLFYMYTKYEIGYY